MIDPVPPIFVFIAGAFLLLFARNRTVKQCIFVLTPVVAFIDLFLMHQGTCWVFRFSGYQLIWGQVDRLSMCFAYVFVIIACLGAIYALHVREDGQHVFALLYIGSTLGVVFAGDLISLIIFWEMMAVFSVFLIWYQRDKASFHAGFRYIMVHLVGGGLLLAGIIMHMVKTGSIQFTAFQYNGLPTALILIGFLINAAVPPLHAWLSDAYPEATITGSVFLSAFTTKSAVYVLLRGFPGCELLVWLGAIMAVYGVIYAFLENNIRRLLAYHIISQVGYMVCGVGLGTELSMNGSTAHAFCHILYKALLFMGVGGVIYATGCGKITELQGRDLYRKMPLCFSLYMVGALSISGVPLFNGFVSKNMIVAAAGEVHRPLIYLLLHLASVGTFLSVGLKLPRGTWFGKSSRRKKQETTAVKEPPSNMLVAMGLTSFLCILIGIFPGILYHILPFGSDYVPYTAFNVVTTMQLLMMTGIAFWILKDKLAGKAAISLDTDWFYRKGAVLFMNFCLGSLKVRQVLQRKTLQYVNRIATISGNPVQAIELILRGRRIRITPYNADRQRYPTGVGINLFFIFFLVACILFFFYTSRR